MNVDITISAQSVTIPSQDVSASIPAAQIVYSNSWLGQTTELSPVTLFTPSSTSLFRLSVSGTIAAYTGVEEYSIVVWWNGTGTPSSGSYAYEWLLNSSTDTTLGGATVFIATAGVPVQLWFRNLNPSGTGGYNVYVTIEQLQ